MADYSESKKFGQNQSTDPVSGEPTKIYPVEGNEVTNLFGRVEPLITPKKMISRYLKGVDLSDYTNDELKDYIEEAINETETLTNLDLTPVQHKERIPFDRQAYKSFVFMKTNNGPIMSVEEILIESSNGENIYKLPPEWIEAGFFHKRQINLIPILSIFGAAGLKDGQASNAGLIFIQAVNNFRWLPAFYTVTYTTGVCRKEGHLPKTLNQVVGMTAAIDILSNKQAQNKYNSTSISQDGISQSASGPGPQLYKQRIEDLEKKRERLMQKLRSKFHQKYFLSNI
jgi:hypothetical protein